jgi:hypothetical protein
MSHEIGRCPHCERELEYERYHAGFGDQGYLYCDQDATVVTWNSYDPTYSGLVGDTHPWMLDDQQKSRVERSVIACPSGGAFRFSANPRCPYCMGELPELKKDPIFFVITGARIDGERQSIWRAPSTTDL